VRSERLRGDLILLFVALLWGTAFVVQRVAAAHMGPFFYTGMRFLLGGAILLPWAGWPWRGLDARDRRGSLLVGLLLFGGATLQQAGLATTTAGRAGFITGLYVVLVPLLLALGWRQRPPGAAWPAAALAVAGLYLLSGTDGLAPPELGSASLAAGDGLELAGAFFWALHVIAVGRLVPRTGGLRLGAAQLLVAGTLSTLRGLWLEGDPGGLVAAWWTVAYTSIVSVGMGYTLQAVGQRWAPPTDAAVILSSEAVFAAAAGWLFLDELLTARQLAGCGLLLAALLLPHLWAATKKQDRAETPCQIEGRR
jgi:drug/metabolite transporter (DMT)-like permease